LAAGNRSPRPWPCSVRNKAGKKRKKSRLPPLIDKQKKEALKIGVKKIEKKVVLQPIFY
jgi:hypothetical protein